MKIEAYIIAFNEAEVITFTLRHYLNFCDTVYVYDNHSTDRTTEIAKQMGAIVIPFGIPGVLSDDEYLKVKNYAWKNSDADWVIVVDTDEIIYHPWIRHVMEQSITNGDTIMTTYGWQIMSHAMPQYQWSEINNGFHYENYSKSAVFSPRLKEIGYVYGCHEARPVGHVQYSKEKLLLAHYANVGGPERLCRKHAMYRTRLSERNRRWGLGVHYMTPDIHQEGKTDEQRIKEWNERYEQSVNFSPELIWPSGHGTMN